MIEKLSVSKVCGRAHLIKINFLLDKNNENEEVENEKIKDREKSVHS